MKLLFDENISKRLVRVLAAEFPDSTHVTLVDHAFANDEAVWDFAKQHGYIIVTKDNDFHGFSVLRGFPPKVIWIRAGNCSTRQLADLLRAHFREIASFESDKTLSLLLLG